MIYSKEERKKPIEHYVDGLTFKSCVDLSCGITIEKQDWFNPTKEEIISQTMTFTAWWMINIYTHLNEFSGIDTVPIKCNF